MDRGLAMPTIFTCLWVTVLCAAPEAMVNGGFEDGQGEVPGAWGVWPPRGRDAGVTQLRVRDEPHSGEWCGRLQVDNAEFKGICTWHHPHIAVEPGMEVIVAGYVRTRGLKGAVYLSVQYRAADDPNRQVGGAASERITADVGWTRIERRCAIPVGVGSIMPVWVLDGQGTAWFDDLTCAVPPTVSVRSLAAAPELDGRLDDPAWSAPPNLTEFVTTGGEPAPNPTFAWVAGDETALYLAFRCASAHPDRLQLAATERDSNVWSDESVEVFLNPAGDRRETFQFVVNAAGVQYDARGVAGAWDADWQAATGREPEAWTVELRIPYASLPIDLEVGDRWAFNACRNDREQGVSSSFSPTYGGFHNPGRLATLAAVPGDFTPFYAARAGAELAALVADYQATRAGLRFEDVEASYATAARELDAQLAVALDELQVRIGRRLDREGWRAVREELSNLRARCAEYRDRSLLLACHTQAVTQGVARPVYGVAVESALRKVFRTGEVSARVAPEVVLDAARDEAESAQLVIQSLGEEVTGVRVELSEFAGPGVPPRAEWYEVAEVPVGQPSYPTERPGPWPDPLPPLGVLDIPAGERRAIWLRVVVPPEAAPGEHVATIRVTATAHAITLPLRVRVRDLRLPRPGALRTSFGLDPDDLCLMLRGERGYLDRLPLEVYAQWNDFLLERRITNSRLGTAYVRETLGPNGARNYDFSLSDQLLEPRLPLVPDRSLVAAGTGNFGWQGANGGRMSYVDAGRDGPGLRLTMPASETWNSAATSCDGSSLAAARCDRLVFAARAEDPAQVDRVVTVFFNNFPDRWVTTFKVPGTQWTEVSIPLAQFRHNTKGTPLGPNDLAALSNFQFVTSKLSEPLAVLLDDIRCVGPGGEVTIDDGDLGPRLRPMVEDVAARAAHWRARGWLGKGVIYGWDEVTPPDYAAALAGYRAVREVAPELPILQTYYTNPRPIELIGAVGVWCPITSTIDSALMAQRQGAGEDFWTYVCCGPGRPYANLFIDYPATAHRVLGWQVFQSGATGLLYWRVNYWHGAFPSQAGERYPRAPWPGEGMATYREFKVNGDGWLLYPGVDDRPVGSVRLETVADGIEDYELLTLLRERYLARREALPPADRAAIEALLAVPPDVSHNWREYTSDPEAILAARRAALDWAERLGG